MDEETPAGGAALPPQYSQGNLGFFTRVTESVPTAVTVGPDDALYIAELTGIPYPEGYARVRRVGDPDALPGIDAATPSGTPQVYASGFDEIHSIAFDAQKNLYVLEYENSNEVYDPALPPAELPPSRLIKVTPEGERSVISGDELKLGNYVLADQATGDLYVSINNTTADNGQVLRYSMDPASGEYDATVVAEGLESPRGLSFGPDGNLYVLEQGVGSQPGDPGYEDAPVLELIPGLVGQRGGYSASITKVDLEGAGGQERVYEGLPSFQEFNPTTGEDRVLGVGVRGFDIAQDGTVWIASGGGLSEESAAQAGEVGQDLRGILKLEGLFGPNPSEATWTRAFDSVAYAGENGPDGATTAFNTQSNLNDVTIGADGELYTVDAARNVLYGLGEDGVDAESVTVLQRRPAVLTPPQFGAVTEADGTPAADYQVEIDQTTVPGPDGLPDTPGRAVARTADLPGAAPAGPEQPTAPGAPGGPAPTDPSGAPMPPTIPTDTAGSVPPPRGEDFRGRSESADTLAGNAGTDALAAPATPPGEPGGAPAAPTSSGDTTASEDGAVIPISATDPTAAPTVPGDPSASPTVPDATGGGAPTGPDMAGGGAPPTIPDTSGGGAPPTIPGAPGGGSPNIPGPIDPLAPPVRADNPYSTYFDPFFGNYEPAPTDPLVLPNGEGGAYSVSNVFSFGDRLTDDGGIFGAYPAAQAAGLDVPYADPPYDESGNFTDGPKWTTSLAEILGAAPAEGQPGDTNLAYADATARPIVNPIDPLQEGVALTNFAGQIDTFEQAYGAFRPEDLVTVTFGGNDITLPSDLSPQEGVTASVGAIVDGLERLNGLGAEHFLVTNLPDITLAPIFSDPMFQEALGVDDPSVFTDLVDQFNAELKTGLAEFEAASGADVKELDLNKLFDGIAAEPSAYGFANVEEPVLANPPQPGTTPTYNPAIVGQDPAVQHATLFLDPFFNPTALGQSIIAETARDALLEPGREMPEESGEMIA